eukprot:TRINITY_DN1546_c0_g5_i1.p1 TRINITY_DN1546_c0_g5~~TRINITY_DN1546_c0_g5_i1.p1  ORF type:complete len:202 (-),score=39.46 TRINITY_DN1546_c0_g5_i1:6-611(-)
MIRGFALVVCLLIVTNVSPISFPMDDEEPRCFRKKVREGDTISGSYVITGEVETGVQVKAVDQKTGQVLLLKEDEPAWEFDYEFQKNTTFRICFTPKSASERLITIELSSYYENSHLFISHDKLDPTSKDLNEGLDGLITLSGEVESQQVREQGHKHLMFVTEKRVKSCSGLKILIIFIITISQICILTRLVKGPTASSPV